MAGSPPLPPDLWATIPPAARAALLAAFAAADARIARLEARVAQLEAQLGKDATNSSQPPSTAHPHAKPAPTRPKSRRSAGGQPGHPRHERALLPADQCQAVV